MPGKTLAGMNPRLAFPVRFLLCSDRSHNAPLTRKLMGVQQTACVCLRRIVIVCYVLCDGMQRGRKCNAHRFFEALLIERSGPCDAAVTKALQKAKPLHVMVRHR